MSVDYRAYYGIGYEVSAGDEVNEDDLEDGLEEYIINECGDEFNCFKTGSGYSGRIDGIYLVIKDPFKNGLDLTQAKNKLDKEITRLKLDIEGPFGIVGGLYIY